MPVKGDYLNKVFTGLQLQQTKKKSRGRPYDIKTLKDNFLFLDCGERNEPFGDVY